MTAPYTPDDDYRLFLNTVGEYIRPSQAPRFGISRSTLYNLISDGTISCRVIRRPGTKKPMRLIRTEELRRYIESCIEK